MDYYEDNEEYTKYLRLEKRLSTKYNKLIAINSAIQSMKYSYNKYKEEYVLNKEFSN